MLLSRQASFIVVDGWTDWGESFGQEYNRSLEDESPAAVQLLKGI